MAMSMTAAPSREFLLFSPRAMKFLFIAIAVYLLFAVLVPHDAFAQATTSTTTGTGDTMYSNLKATMFSGYGLLFSVIILIVGVVIWIKRGIGEGLLVMAAGFGFFLIPAAVYGMKTFGQSLAS